MTIYEIIPVSDGTYSVEISGGDVDVTWITPGFKTVQEAEDFVAQERRKAGHDPRWPELRDDE